MNPIPPLPRWLSLVFSPPSGRHRQGAAPSRPPRAHRPVRKVPNLQPIRMDDPTDLRRYAMVRAPLLWWEARGSAVPARPPALVHGALVGEGVG